MAVKNITQPTLLDVAQHKDPDGSIADIVELLAESNEIITDAPAIQCNDGSGHKTTVRSDIPEGTWRKLNYGVKPEKSTTVQIRDTTGMLETYAKVDKALADMSGDPAEFRMSENRAFIEGMNQTVANTMFYGDTSVNPERFTGFAPRYDDVTAENADNILLGGASAGQTDCTSIYYVGWSPRTCHLIYPDGAVAGLSHRDLFGEDTSTDSQNREYQIYRSHYCWKVGLCVRDWRYVVRISDIDTSLLKKDASSGADLIDLMIQALEIPPVAGDVKWGFYCNRTVRSFLRRQISNKNNVELHMDEVAGKKVMMFGDVPVRRCDALLDTETALAV